MRFLIGTTFVALVFAFTPLPASAAASCAQLPDRDSFLTALREARAQANGGLNLDMWGAMVDRSGVICHIAHTGVNYEDQWPGSRIIAAQKAYTANAFSVNGLALSTANLYSAVQPGGPLFGLQESNPIYTELAYQGPPANFGEKNDPLTGRLIGGINVFGGGVPLYNTNGILIGAIGVSGDTSCADHNIAWRVRDALGLDFVPAGVSPTKNDQIVYDITNGRSAGGYGHPTCGGTEANIAKALPTTQVSTTSPAAP